MSGYIMLDAPNRAQPQGTHPRRGGHKPSGTCIVHTSEGNWRNGVDSLTRLVQTRTDWGCYHRACDWADIAKYYPWEWETWQDTETNNWAVGIAAACKASDWPTMPADIREGYYRNLARMAADFVAYMRTTHGVTVPLRRLSGAEARNRVPGFCAHGDSGIHRSDPGPAFDWALFFKYTRQALDGGTIQTHSAPKEDTLSAEEVKQIKDHINAVMLGGYQWRDSAGVMRKHPGIGMVVEENQRRIEAIPAKVWATPVVRTGGNVSALQELADTKTKVLGIEPAIARIDANTDPAALADLIPDALAQQVIDKLAERLGK